MLEIAKKILRKFDNHDAIYDDAYYASDVSGPANQAAPHIARTIVTQFAPKSLIDVGCGTGAMLDAFRACNVRVSGLEYSRAAISLCIQRGLEVRKFNIERDNAPNEARRDMALSLEVAEHLPESCSDRFVSLLCGFAPIVVCSAAQPGQQGTDHVNLKPRSYWIEKFKTRQFDFDQASASHLADQWKECGVAGFYHDNLMIFRAR